MARFLSEFSEINLHQSLPQMLQMCLGVNVRRFDPLMFIYRRTSRPKDVVRKAFCGSNEYSEPSVGTELLGRKAKTLFVKREYA